MMTRDEHMDWCKSRALEYLNHGDIKSAVGSMLSDMNKHPQTWLEPGSILNLLGMQAIMSNDAVAAWRFIEGFN